MKHLLTILSLMLATACHAVTTNQLAQYILETAPYYSYPLSTDTNLLAIAERWDWSAGNESCLFALDTENLGVANGVGFGRPWTPADLASLEQWWDAQDFSSISTNSFGVYNIANQVSGGIDAYHTTTAEYPAYSANGLNGYPSIDFGVGGIRRLYLGATGVATTNHTYAAVFDRASSASISAPFGSWAGGNTVAPLQWIANGRVGPVMSGFYKLKNSQTQTGDFITVSYGGTTIGELGISTNGTVISTFDLSGSQGHSPITALGYSSGAGTTAGKIGEWIIFNEALVEPDRQKLEGYLAHKWGLTANLPSDHPYKSTVPTGGTATISDRSSYGNDAVAAGSPVHVMPDRTYVAGIDPVWDSLIAYYPLDGTAYDEISATTGTWGADVVATNDAISGTAASLDTSANAYVTTVNAGLLHNKTAYTISGWAKIRSYDFVGGLVFSYSSATRFLGVRQYTSSEKIFGGYYSTAANTPTAAANITNGSWFHFAQTWEQGETVKLYIDGLLAATSSVNNGAVYQTATFLLGLDGSSSARKTDGVIDEVAILDRAWTSNEVYRVATEQLTYP